MTFALKIAQAKARVWPPLADVFPTRLIAATREQGEELLKNMNENDIPEMSDSEMEGMEEVGGKGDMMTDEVAPATLDTFLFPSSLKLRIE